jgi:subtilisin family serine protease
VNVPVGQEEALASVLGGVTIKRLYLDDEPDWNNCYLPMVYGLAWPPDPINQWGAWVMNVPFIAPRADGPIVAVIDGGWHDDFEDQVNVVDIWLDDADPGEVTHGTHVTSIIGSPHNALGIAGICPQCRFLLARACGPSGCWEDTLAYSIDWAVEHGAQIINMSWGTPYSSSVPMLRQSILDAYNAGVILVASRGNAGSDALRFPASWPEVWAVSALNQNLTLASFSSYYLVDFAAPGEGVIAGCGPGSSYCYKSGTSMAAPHIVGMAGLVLDRYPEWDRDQVYDWLSDLSIDLGEPGCDEKYGWGMPIWK